MKIYNTKATCSVFVEEVVRCSIHIYNVHLSLGNNHRSSEKKDLCGKISMNQCISHFNCIVFVSAVHVFFSISAGNFSCRSLWECCQNQWSPCRQLTHSIRFAIRTKLDKFLCRLIHRTNYGKNCWLFFKLCVTWCFRILCQWMNYDQFHQDTFAPMPLNKCILFHFNQLIKR